MDLRQKVNAAVQQLAKDNNASFRILLDDDIVRFVIQTVKQRLHQKNYNKSTRLAAKAYRDIQRVAISERNNSEEEQTPLGFLTSEALDKKLKTATEEYLNALESEKLESLVEMIETEEEE